MNQAGWGKTLSLRLLHVVKPEESDDERSLAAVPIVAGALSMCHTSKLIFTMKCTNKESVGSKSFRYEVLQLGIAEKCYLC